MAIRELQSADVSVLNFLPNPCIQLLCNRTKVRFRRMTAKTRELLFNDFMSPLLITYSAVDLFPDEGGGIDVSGRLSGVFAQAKALWMGSKCL